jgi:hypothetical protein
VSLTGKSVFGSPLGQYLLVDTPTTSQALLQALAAQAEALAATKCVRRALSAACSYLCAAVNFNRDLERRGS